MKLTYISSLALLLYTILKICQETQKAICFKKSILSIIFNTFLTQINIGHLNNLLKILI